jgi:transcriptional regulator with XRE-family HTH domain
MPKNDIIVARLCRLKENRGTTWRQLASDLGISLSMALMVKSGARALGQEALSKLEALERKSPDLPPPTAKERTAVAGRSRARLTLADRERGYVELDVSYRSGTSAGDSPRRIRVSRPPENAVENVYKLVGDTWEVKIALLACLPDALATEDFLEALSTKSYLAVQSGTLFSRHSAAHLAHHLLELAHLFHHLLHLRELVQHRVQLGHGHAAAFGDADAAFGVEDLRACDVPSASCRRSSLPCA